MKINCSCRWKAVSNVIIIMQLLLLSVSAGCAESNSTTNAVSTNTQTSIGNIELVPASTTGQVKGVLVYKPAENAITAGVNLVPVKLSDDGTTFTYSVELLRERSMSVKLVDGAFLFENVKPGTYRITANIEGRMPIPLTISGDETFFIIKGGDQINLGDVKVKN